MNFLAHAHLSRHDDQLLAGQMLGDFLEPGWRERLPPRVLQGIALHQQVDRFTDTHPVFARSRQRLAPRFRRYGGVLVDVFYDHFLARNWSRYHAGESLGEFSQRVYGILARNDDWLTDRLRRTLPSMTAHDWLSSYSRLDAIDRALAGISRRLTRSNPLPEGGGELRAHHGVLEADFHAFFPDLEAFVEARHAELD